MRPQESSERGPRPRRYNDVSQKWLTGRNYVDPNHAIRDASKDANAVKSIKVLMRADLLLQGMSIGGTWTECYRKNTTDLTCCQRRTGEC